MVKRGWIGATGLLLAACQQPAPKAAPEQDARAASPTPGAIAGSKQPAAVSAEPARSGTGLCAGDEPALFSCRVRSGKIASVCGAAGADGERFAQYRYGRPGAAPELVFPASASDGKIAFASTPYSGGGEGQLMFERGGVRYIVYSRTIRTRFDGEGNDPVNEDGVAVMRGERMVSRLACIDADVKPVDYDLSDRLAGDAPDIVMLPE